MEYITDAAQRGILFLDVMRQRGNQYHEHLAENGAACSRIQGRTSARRPQLAALAAMLPPDAETRRKALESVDAVLRARGELSAEDRKRLDEIAKLFGIDGESGASPTPLRPVRRDLQPRAS